MSTFDTLHFVIAPYSGAVRSQTVSLLTLTYTLSLRGSCRCGHMSLLTLTYTTFICNKDLIQPLLLANPKKDCDEYKNFVFFVTP